MVGLNARSKGTYFGRVTFCHADMDDKSINLWRQIEGARRVGKRQVGRVRPTAAPTRPAAGL